MTPSRAPARATATRERAPAPRAAAALRAIAAPGAAASLHARVGQQGAQALIARAAASHSSASTTTTGAMRVSSPGEPAELEAESTAKKVMRSTAAPVAARDAQGAIARKADGPPTVTPNISADIAGSTGSGAPLPTGVRTFMEPRFKADFSKVRVHTGPRAEQLSVQLNARAFTVGNNIFFAKDQFKPESPDGMELIAHELTHTIQQGGAVQRSEAPEIRVGAPQQVQRDWLPGPIDYAADKAYLIPGFRMLTMLLGFNPINMNKVNRSAANILRALLELLPGGALLTDALNNSGVFDKAGAWVEQKLQTLGMAAASIKLAIDQFLASLSRADFLDPAGVWERAKHIVTRPIDRIIDFGKGLIDEIIKFVKDAMLLPLAKLAEPLPSWKLLTAVLGKNPITGEPVARTAETVIGGFMKLIGQDEVWENMQKAGAVPRAWAWFQGAMAALMGFVGQLPALAKSALQSLKLEDIVLLPRAFVKVGAVFGTFVGEFTTWAGKAVWTLLEIVVDSISPGAFGYIKRTGAALKSILKNPLPFVGNLVKAAKLGFLNFAGNILGHLKAGLMDWLLGALPGVYIPKAFSLGEIVKFAFSVLGISWQNIRGKLVKAVGETAVAAMEAGFDIVKTLVKDGPAAAWEKIKEQLADLKDKVIGGIIDFVVDMVVKKAVPKLVAMFIPGAGFLSAILSIYDTVMVFVDKIAKIAAVVKGFIDSIVAIAGGAIGAAAGKVEGILAGLLSLAINFLAGFAGLGKVADKVMGVIGKVRATIDKALDAMIAWIVKTAKSLFAKAFGKKEEKGGPKDPKHDAKVATGLAAVKNEEKKFLVDGELTADGAGKVAAQIKKDHPIFKAFTVKQKGAKWSYHYVASKGEVDGAAAPKMLIVSVKSIKEKASTSPSSVSFSESPSKFDNARSKEASIEFEKLAAADIATELGVATPEPRQKDRWPAKAKTESGLPENARLLSQPKTNLGGKAKKDDLFRRPDFVVLAPGGKKQIEVVEATLDAAFSVKEGDEGRREGRQPHKRGQISATVFALANRYKNKNVAIIYTIRCPREPAKDVVDNVNTDLKELHANKIDIQIVWIWG